MKYLFLNAAFFVSMTILPASAANVSAAVAASGETVSIASLLREETDLSRLPLHRNRRTHLVSSNDPTGGNDDYSNFVSREGNKAVLADLHGPGAIVRIWSTGLKKAQGKDTYGPGGILKIYIDDNPVPVVNTRFADFFKGPAPFVPPFTRVSGSASFTYLPIPYAKHCLVTVDLDGTQYFFHQINSLEFPDGTKVRSFALPLTAEDQAALDRATAAWTLSATSTAGAVAPTTTKLTIPAGGSRRTFQR